MGLFLRFSACVIVGGFATAAIAGVWYGNPGDPVVGAGLSVAFGAIAVLLMGLICVLDPKD